MALFCPYIHLSFAHFYSMLRFLNSDMLFIFTVMCYPDAVWATEPLLFLLFKFIWGIFSFGIFKHRGFEHACNCLLAQCADAKSLGYGR